MTIRVYQFRQPLTYIFITLYGRPLGTRTPIISFPKYSFTKTFRRLVCCQLHQRSILLYLYLVGKIGFEPTSDSYQLVHNSKCELECTSHTLYDIPISCIIHNLFSVVNYFVFSVLNYFMFQLINT